MTKIETTLEKQIRATNERFDELESDLKKERQRIIDDIFINNINSGVLKNELA